MNRKHSDRGNVSKRVGRLARRASIERLEARRLLATFTVVDTRDDELPGSLRWAIGQANSDTSSPTIEFAVPGEGAGRIELLQPLPPITRPVEIDGTTQRGFQGTPLIEIDGSRLGAGASGLVLVGGGGTVRGLAIGGFSEAAIILGAGDGSRIYGNALGTDPTGFLPRPNGTGILVVDSSWNTIGGSGAGESNVISANFGDGIRIARLDEETVGNVVEGNRIGVTADGLSAIGNGGSGIRVMGASDSRIGGPFAASSNVVAGNWGDGISLLDGATRTLIVGNRVGVSADDRSALGNLQDGIRLSNAPANTIGGTGGAGNVIGGNLGGGVVARRGSDNLIIQGNAIGTSPVEDLDLGNHGDGVSLGSGGNLVGGPSASSGNRIAFNGSGGSGAGVQLVGLVNRNSILSNSIFENSGLGINLGNGPTPNHSPDATGPGPNDWQNFPTFEDVTSDGAVTRAVGVLHGVPGASYTVQFFATPEGDPSGFGEGKSLLGSSQVTTNREGIARFSVTTAPSMPGRFFSATATDALGNTSEFSSNLPIRAVPDLVLEMQASPGPVAIAGGPLRYRVDVRNVGNGDAEGVTVQQLLPDGVTLLSAKTSQGGVMAASPPSVAAWLGTLPAGSSASLEVEVQLPADLNGTLASSATATFGKADPTPEDNRGSVTTLVATEADLGLTVGVEGTPRVGEDQTYILTVSNRGPSIAAGVMLSLPILPAEQLISADAPQGSVRFDGGLVTVSLGDLVIGASVTMSVVVRPEVAGTYTRTAQAVATSVDADQRDNSRTLSTTVLPRPSLSVTLETSGERFVSGQLMTYELTVANLGTEAAESVVVRSSLPPGTSFQGAEGDFWGLPAFEVDTLTAPMGTLPPGSMATVRIHLRITAAAGSVLTGRATVEADDLDPNEPAPTATLTTIVRGRGDLLTAIAQASASVPAGQPLPFSITVTNAGPDDDPNVSLDLDLPPQSFLLGPLDRPDLGPAPTLASLGPLRAGASATLDFLLFAPGSNPGLIEVRATASGENVEVTPGDNGVIAYVGVDPSADLQVRISHGPGPLLAGLPAYFEVSVFNAGPWTATEVIAELHGLSSLDLLDVRASRGSLRHSASPGPWLAELGAIASGETATIAVAFRPGGGDDAWPATAFVTSPAFDPDRSNNQASAWIAIEPAVDLDVSVAASPSTVQLGDSISLVTTIVNRGPSSATGVVVVTPPAASAPFHSAWASQGAATLLPDGSLSAELGDLPPGAAAVIRLDLRAGGPGLSTWAIAASAEEQDLDGSNNRATAEIHVLDRPGRLEFAAPAIIVDETAGVARVEVRRTGGSRGTISAEYRTEGGDATAGVDYLAMSGTLRFEEGETSGWINLPILPNPHNRGDESVRLILESPAGGASLGQAATTLVRIRDLDPDGTAPTVIGLDWSGTSTAIGSVTLSFSEPIATEDLIAGSTFRLSDLGLDGTVGADHALRMVVNPGARSVTLVPDRPLASGRYFRVDVASGGPNPVGDLAGNALATSYVASFGQGTSLKYSDSDGDVVTLKLSGGGYLRQIRDASGEGRWLGVVDTVPRRSTLSGNVSRNRNGGNGSTDLGAIEGLGRFGEVRVTLSSPRFLVGQYPFFKTTGRGPARAATPRRQVAAPAVVRRHPAPLRRANLKAARLVRPVAD